MSDGARAGCRSVLFRRLMPKRRPTPKKHGFTPASHTKRRRREATELPLNKAWSLPSSVLADDVRAAAKRLVCRLGYGGGNRTD